MNRLAKHSAGRSRASIALILFAILLSPCAAFNAAAQSPGSSVPAALPASASPEAVPASAGPILLVLPFDNRTSPAIQPGPAPNSLPTPNAASGAAVPGSAIPTSASPESTSLDWLREAAPAILNARFTSAGLTPLTREDRIYALDHLGLPETFQPSHATALRIAQTLDANFICIGSYTVAGGQLTLKAHLVDVDKLRLGPETVQAGPLAQLIPLLNSLAWQLTRQLEPGFNVVEETFRAAGSNIRLDAFEQYIRGLSENRAGDRLLHLKKATDLSPDFTAAWLATAKLQFESQQYEQAAVSFSKVRHGDPSALEASFYEGLSLIFSGNYPRAAESFAAIARLLPLPEVVNNQAVAESRRGHDATPLFRQAVAADPNDADYHFNLAVSLHAHGDNAAALTEIAESLKLHPYDSEAKAAQQSWQSASSGAPGNLLERIKRSYNGTAFRQAELMLDQVEEARLATLPASERAARLNKSAHEKLDRGLLLEAERSYQSALAADSGSAEAHAGLAQVRERAGDSEAARKEARAALDRRPNLDAYMVLARLDLAANNLPQARDEAAQAVKLDSNNRAARDLRKVIETRMETIPAGENKNGVSQP